MWTIINDLGWSKERVADELGMVTSTVNLMLQTGKIRVTTEKALRHIHLTEIIKRPCPDCGGPLCALRSMDKLMCSDCKAEFKWTLDLGQRSLVGNNRQDRKTP